MKRQSFMAAVCLLALAALPSPLPAQVPTGSTDMAIALVASTAAESSHVFLTKEGNVYRSVVNTTTTGGFMMGFDATSAPVDGAVTPKLCRSVGAYSSLEVDRVPPDHVATGWTLVFSTGADCLTKTASATVTFEASVK